MYLPELGPKIKRLRQHQKLSQADLGKLVGVSKSVISSYEKNVHCPPYDILIKIAATFGVSTDYLLGLSGNRTIHVDGLSDSQIEALTIIVNELRAANEAAPASPITQ